MVERTGLGSLCLSDRGGVPGMCVGGGESELGQVMLAYSVISFFRKYSLFLNWCDLMLFLLVLEFMHVCVFVYRYS